ncbi:MAG: UDP-N-acetylmuramoyl-L-alanyl-D-glutamate--2,6-diaminopimelate ligase [Actinomycetia bacterium]|nr:UDP-N-acetylmuramoyl-L-alanyl-D-glutamate--2,6-diaminopimelate ligase [Actinomycetes bacterium]MCP4221789.1 UDP-N-acetylmuramoyl-L-alanyl-D-glutamate--2,6-diaminopimelate ligase [Actinomycetes bacterium]
MSCLLGEVGKVIGVTPDSGVQAVISGATHDSRAVKPGWLFCCIPGANVDGHLYAETAVGAGAAALLCERTLDLDIPQLVVADARAAMGPVASRIEGDPSHHLPVIGVTGTNGKSSVVQILADIWAKAGRRADVYGTMTGARTTPEAPDLQRQLRASLSRGADAVAMEVSSHALDLCRVAGTRFAASVFTNLGRDHLDFHHTMDDYFEAKAALFTAQYTSVGVINLDDQYGIRLGLRVRDDPEVELRGFRLSDAEKLVIDGPRSHFSWHGRPVVLQLAGRHNVMNALAAATTAEALGLDEQVIVDGLCATEPVRGRFEMIDIGQPFKVAVDYAHTPDALAAVLGAAHQVTAGRVIVVFGCGGDRDQLKRGEMGSVAQSESDVMIITSDNPRSEDPLAIIDEILNGTDTGPDTKVIVEADRRRAIAAGLANASAGDLVLVAGKGHEMTQTIGDSVQPFDDRQVIIEELGAMT